MHVEMTTQQPFFWALKRTISGLGTTRHRPRWHSPCNRVILFTQAGLTLPLAYRVEQCSETVEPGPYP